MTRRTVLLLATIGAAAVLTGVLLARMLGASSVPLESGTWLPQPRALAEFHLQDLSGAEFDLESLRHQPTLLFFGFTNCPDVCPTTLATLTQVQRAAPLPGTRVVFVTIDPERDSAANLQVYLGAFSKSFIGARGSAAALAPLLKSVGAIAVRQNLPDGSYTMDHSATLYLLDTGGRLVAVFSPPFSAPKLTADLRRVAAAARL
ncbi:MAG TPA: SCO family protein [Steroidobacteraceae bacterium]|jgi:protein SCO1/2|nr:SCO family protein [Steroidobacteraceae bacterium]